MNSKLREATLRLIFQDDGSVDLLGEMTLEFLGRFHRVMCAPEEVIAIHQAAASAAQGEGAEEGQHEEQREEEAWSPLEEVVLGGSPREGAAHRESVTPPGKGPDLPVGIPVRVGEGAPSPARVVPFRSNVIPTDSAGNPVLPQNGGVLAAELLGATNPGENGVDLL